MSLSIMRVVSQGREGQVGMYSAGPTEPQLGIGLQDYRPGVIISYLKSQSSITTWKLILYPLLPILLMRRAP